MTNPSPEPTSILDIVATIKAQIQAGALAPGQRLIEVDLAQAHHVGRGRIREVLKTLVGEGYLEFVENRGVYVRRFPREEILAMGRVREVLEGLTARLAAEREKTEAECAELLAHQQALDAAEAITNIDAFNAENFAYHDTIARLAGNSHATAFLGRVRLPLYRLLLPRTFSFESIHTSNRDHRVITSAILSNNGDAAEAAMRAHVRTGNSHVARLAGHHFG